MLVEIEIKNQHLDKRKKKIAIMNRLKDLMTNIVQRLNVRDFKS